MTLEPAAEQYLAGALHRIWRARDEALWGNAREMRNLWADTERALALRDEPGDAVRLEDIQHAVDVWVAVPRTRGRPESHRSVRKSAYRQLVVVAVHLQSLT